MNRSPIPVAIMLCVAAYGCSGSDGDAGNGVSDSAGGSAANGGAHSTQAGAPSVGSAGSQLPGSGGNPPTVPPAGDAGSGADGGSVAAGGAGVGAAGAGAGGAPSASGGRSNGAGGKSSSGGAAGAGGASGEPVLPTPQQACAPFKQGKMTILGVQASVWVGTPTSEQHGAVIVYWHGTGSSGQEAQSAFGSAAISAIVAEGGIVVAPETTTKQGTNTGNGVWYTGDFALADEVVGCAAQQLRIDSHRIHSAGYSAGGLQAAWMSAARSNYLASVVSYSGGIAYGSGPALQNPANEPAALVAHGAAGSDVFILDFATASQTYEQQIRKHGGFAIDCDDGGAHVDVSKRFKVGPQAWEFLKAHPFQVRPEPYASALPSDFPSYCKVVP
jgi:dienelactone hydrolase